MGIEAFEKLSPEKQNSILQAGIQEFSQKSFPDASTDTITQHAGISKGLLFHYFGSKKSFYLACLRCALDRLIAQTPEATQNDFYSVLFFTMDEKIRLCRDFPAETLFVNLAARDSSAEISAEKLSLFSNYLAVTTKASREVLARAIFTLPLSNPNDPTLLDALSLYVGAINQKYLLFYREKPFEFFEHAAQIQAEMKTYIDYLLYGVVKQEG